ncbi:uncharacterized protein LOC127131587 [Lathyrus oleraceus]|uniref:uncharacterized protein LOC127131587 n=1 Tax=Pisum sativum TaxID=3888 RepID=UPI0021D1A5AF|nr:uncharacterized protein LOC127131587 [Pisum sativum]
MKNFVSGLGLKTKQLIDTSPGGLSNFTTATGIKKIIEVIVANEHLELYDMSIMTNPREHNNVSVVVLRSGKSTKSPEDKLGEEDLFMEVDLEIKENQKTSEEDTQKMVDKEKPKEPNPTIKLPYPSRSKKKDQHEIFLEKFLEIFKRLEIKIQFYEALKQMPIYAKIMKDIISKNCTIDTEPILLTETYNAILQGMKILVKKKDNGSVTIPYIIKDRNFKKELIDLGESVSLMPLSIYRKLGKGIVQDIMMTLQLADHSIKRPYGIVEDVLVKIDKFVFPVDFIILEMPEDEEIPPILGKTFPRNREMHDRH